MYKSFKIRNFRCFQELGFNDFALVNLIAGMNEVGKTALLEAIFLHCGAYHPELTLAINSLRGFEKVDLKPGYWSLYLLASLFNEFDVSKEIELVGHDTVTGHRSLCLKASGDLLRSAVRRVSVLVSGKSTMGYIKMKDDSEGNLESSEITKVLELEYKGSGEQGRYYMMMDSNGTHTEPLPPKPPFQTFLQDTRTRIPFLEQARLYGNLELHGKQEQFLRILKTVEPRLEVVRTLNVPGGMMLHGDIGIGHLVPIPMMGQGIVRLANLVLQIGNAPDGVVLFDEIDNGLHYSVMFKIWKAVALASRQSKTQVFATTHSWECIRAAHQAFTLDRKYDFRLHRLGRIDGEISAVTYDQEALDGAIRAGLEVR
jgi:hypothetical protein